MYMKNIPRLAPIIALGSNDWTNAWMTRQQYLSRLGRRGWHVVYSVGSQSVWNRRVDGAPVFARVNRTDQVDVFEPGRYSLRWPTHPVWDRAVIWNEARGLKQVADVTPDRPGILFVTDPRFAPYLDFFPECRVFYFCEDAFSLMPDWSESNDRHEALVVERADMIATCAPSMAEHLPGDGPDRARILRNGVDFAAFAGWESQPCPEDLAAIPHPRIGYTGSINLKVDFRLVADVATQRPDWHWVMVGPIGMGGSGSFGADEETQQGYEACVRLPNVHFLGVKPFYDLPAYVGHMDVNAMCYRQDGSAWWKAIDPLKTNEYLAVGKPIVSVDQVNVRSFSDVLDIAVTADDWVAAVTRALDGQGAGTVPARRERARANDWSSKADEMERWLFELVEDMHPTPADKTEEGTQLRARTIVAG